jgi:four helix bundle protein
MKISKFEDLPIWQESRKVVNKTYKLLDSNLKIKKDYSLSDQLKRSAYSIMLNISEGFERGSNKEFSNFLNIAKGSAGEVRCILYILFDNNYIDKNKFDEFYSDLEKISIQLSNFRKFLLKHSHFKK